MEEVGGYDRFLPAPTRQFSKDDQSGLVRWMNKLVLGETASEYPNMPK